MTIKQSVLFLDNRIISADKSTIESLSPWNLTGQGVFETMRVYQGQIFALDLHLERLLKGLKTLNIKATYTQRKLALHLKNALKMNGLKDARLRLTIWQEDRTLRISIISTPMDAYLPLKYKKGFRATISDIKRDESSKLSYIKSIEYLPLMMAYRKAQEAGFDEAILLNHKDHIAEASRSNVFFVQNGALYTPALRCGCLNGITRHIVMTLARQGGLKVKSVSATQKDLLRADEAFLTNSTMEIMPLTSLEGHQIAQGTPGKITTKLMAEYKKLL